MRFGTFSYNQSRPAVPEKQAFEELLEQILLTEKLGFDEAWFAEHHHSDYGMLASPNLIIATLAPRTQRLRMGNLVNVLPLYDPMRLAEECGMLDILTNGRLNVGLGRGVPRDDLKHGLDRDTAQARFEEGIEILHALLDRRHFHLHRQSVGLRRNHLPSAAAAETASADLLRRHFARQPGDGRAPRLEPRAVAPTARELRAGDPVLSRRTRQAQRITGTGDAIMVRDIYVADTDEQAWNEATPQITRFWQLATDNVWRGDSVSTDDLPKFTERFPYFPGGLTVKRLDEWGTSLIGSPDTVIKKARVMIETARPDSLVGMFSFGGLKHEQVMHSIDLFATKVMPALGA